MSAPPWGVVHDPGPVTRRRGHLVFKELAGRAGQLGLPSSAMGGLIALAVVVAVGFLLTYAHSHRADGKTSAVWDCDLLDCRYRNKAMHRHPT